MRNLRFADKKEIIGKNYLSDNLFFLLAPWAPPKPGSFFEKKEVKKLYNGKLTLFYKTDYSHQLQNSSAKRKFRIKVLCFFLSRKKSGLG